MTMVLHKRKPKRARASVAERIASRLRFCNASLELPNHADEPDAAARISLLKVMPNQCRWPYGDMSKGTFCFCGQQAKEGSAWCTHHHARAYRAAGADAMGDAD